MRDYYTHARNVYLITRTLEQRLALVPSKGRELLKSRSELGPGVEPDKEFDGFRVADGQLHFESKNLLKEDRGRLLRAFLEAHRDEITTVFFDIAGPHPMQATPADVIAALDA